MPIHDWTRADACLFSNLQLSWSVSISQLFNTGRLPSGYYSLVEQHKTGFGFELADVGPTDSGDEGSENDWQLRRRERMSRESWPDPPQSRFIAEDDLERYRCGHKTVTIRDESDHAAVAAIEIVWPASIPGASTGPSGRRSRVRATLPLRISRSVWPFMSLRARSAPTLSR